MDSSFSKALPADMAPSVKSEWRRVNTFSAGSQISPHYVFHGAIAQIHRLTSIWRLSGISDELRCRTVMHVLALWQYGNSDELADSYIRILYGLMEDDLRQQLQEYLMNLQMPLIETNGSQVIHELSKIKDSLSFKYIYTDG